MKKIAKELIKYFSDQGYKVSLDNKNCDRSRLFIIEG